ncbi:MAG TPA: flagellar biosynthesis anti-sigma factor FlgM [Terriglobia bacterium]|nr:flagellar biosynthesis anti-sigma factor FlgM [Terriglobia bacterium]
MKIDGPNSFSCSFAPAVTSARSSTKPDFQAIQSAAESDVTEFSRLRDAGGLLSQLKQMPDVRRQRVEALRDAIQSGRYRVSDRQLANALYTRLVSYRPRLVSTPA